MPLKEPSWWYGPASTRNTLIAKCLSPLSTLYSMAGQRRLTVTTPWKAPVPVICIGNLTAGGTGKTPTARAVAQLAAANGHTPAFLSRGYTGSTTAPTWVDVAIHTAEDVGDEPLLLAADHPTLVAKHRADGARRIVATRPDISLIILDDGLLNPQLKQDYAIALIDGQRGLGNGRVIPSGPLRAPLHVQLPRVDLAIIKQAADPDQSLPLAVLRASTIPIGKLQIRARPLNHIDKTRPVIAFCGIGNPKGFYETLKAEGFTLVDTVSFADHASLSEADAKALFDKAASSHAALVTTEKDAARLNPVNPAHMKLREKTAVLMIDVVFDDVASTAIAAALRR
ncbi:MAG: tetraacyldisaccharide 4'-kinase [Pseudomonadota bacterium]